MAAVFEETFRVRQYECDMYGHLNNVNYVRYMQEAALNASADVGWDIARYESIGRLWLIRETDIEYLLPLEYNTTVTVKTWVADFRRVQSRRMYEFWREDGELAARASTNWVFIDTATQQPVTVPDEMIWAFAPDGLEPIERAEKFPKAPAPPENVYTLRKRVEWRDIDAVGHVNNAAYMSYCEDASTQVSRYYGWGMGRLLNEGFGIIARRYRILYLQPAYVDEEVDIACWFSDFKRAMATRHYTITRVSDEELLARARVLWIFFDIEKQRPRRVLPEFIQDFALNMSPEG